MSTSHHGGPHEPDRQSELMKRFVEQAEGIAKRAYSEGRVSAEDEGDLALAVTADHEHKIVILSFGKHVEWIGMNATDCFALATMLIDNAKLVSKPGGDH